MLQFAGFELDTERVELRPADGEVIRLRPKTFALLHLFATNANRLLSKQELMTAIWPNVHVGDDSLFQCIREIRTALGDKDRQIVKSVSGRGYLFDADVVVVDRSPADAVPPAAAEADGGPLPAEPDPAPSLQPPLLAPAADGPVAGRPDRLPRPRLLAAVVAVVAIGATIAATLVIQRTSTPEMRTIAVQPFDIKAPDPASAAMASTVADRLTDGLSKIGNVRVLAPETQPVIANVAAPPTTKADLVVRGELQREDGNWQLQARLIDSRTGQVQWAGGIRVPADTISERLQQSRLTAGIGNPLALRINALTQRAMPPESKIIAEQAAAFLNQTNRERFKVAQELLEKSHAAAPDDVEISAALSAHLMRGVAMVWYPPSEHEDIEKRARDLLRDAVKTEPSYIPVLQAYCRLLQNTNQFAETLVACENALRFDPWDGLVMFQIGMAQVRLGRYQDALATFERADAADTPEVSRWTWLLGAGLTLVLMERYDDALTWLHRSRAITPATGRTDFMIAACYQALGRAEEARVAVATGLRLRPGTTSETVGLPPKNESPRFLADSAKVRDLLVAAGLPPK